ncbi:hypothetical protein CI238_11353 [Colletotrichum incanum]|uniref:Uncharacterized protein n=1 Tax=Colletotrichum incanum TaxID=1573173 RepID=A0A167AZX0_COLIC|nr:hypothetical protein CI238_11353 [Colletotrichum incanum]OHW99907.1 hypothetical protein CSPAE12_01382 [Colletotrichum incanum]
MAVYNSFAEMPLARPTLPCNFDEDVEALVATKTQSASRRKLRCLVTSPYFLYLTTIITILSLYGIQLSDQDSLWSHMPPARLDGIESMCGASAEEARSMGCVFDVYVNEWLPALCYDRAVAEMSESNSSDLYPAAAGRTTFPLFWDSAMVKPATLEDVMLTAFNNIENGFNIDFYTAWEYHRAHCLHLWRLTVSALQRIDRGEKNVGVYYKSASPEHVWHCNKFILKGDTRDPDDITSITPGIGKCVVLNSF